MSNELEIESQINSETSACYVPIVESPSSSPIVFTGKIFRAQRGRKTIFQRSKPRGQSKLKANETDESNPIPLAYTLAFAHHMEMLISSGEVKDRAELARIFGLSRARVTQIMNLTLLAPDIQELILFAETRADETDAGFMTERAVRQLVAMADWGEQRKTWRQKAG